MAGSTSSLCHASSPVSSIDPVSGPATAVGAEVMIGPPIPAALASGAGGLSACFSFPGSPLALVESWKELLVSKEKESLAAVAVLLGLVLAPAASPEAVAVPLVLLGLAALGQPDR
jgi:hypothetical protein